MCGNRTKNFLPYANCEHNCFVIEAEGINNFVRFDL